VRGERQIEELGGEALNVLTGAWGGKGKDGEGVVGRIGLAVFLECG